MAPCCRASTALISPSVPEADWAWPRLVLIDASAQVFCDAVYLCQAGVFDGVTDRVPVPCCLHHADGAGVARLQQPMRR